MGTCTPFSGPFSSEDGTSICAAVCFPLLMFISYRESKDFSDMLLSHYTQKEFPRTQKSTIYSSLGESKSINLICRKYLIFDDNKYAIVSFVLLEMWLFVGFVCFYKKQSVQYSIISFHLISKWSCYALIKSKG